MARLPWSCGEAALGGGILLGWLKFVEEIDCALFRVAGVVDNFRMADHPGLNSSTTKCPMQVVS
jgi:hypothetical protein